MYVCICIIFYDFNDKHLIFASNFDYELLIIIFFNEIGNFDFMLAYTYLQYKYFIIICAFFCILVY